MKTFTKIMIIINVISLTGTAILFPSLLTIISYSPAFTLAFTSQAIVALVFFLIWILTGAVLFIKFLKKMSFPRKLFFVTVSYTGVFAMIVVALLNINSINYSPVANLVATTGIGANASVIYVLIAGFSLIYVLALSLTYRRMTKPIKRINTIITNINSGEHKAQGYKLSGSKEFAQIGENLTELDKTIIEKDKLLKIANDEYEKIVPKQFLHFLGVKNFTGLELGGNVSKEVTTMFCDLKQSTLKSESLTLSDNFKFISSYLAIISPIIRKYNGFVDKYLGDGILAVFMSASDAVFCSKEIVSAINIKNSLLELPYKIEVNIGIHTGEVVFGVVGDAKRKSPTIISDNVNYTSKMQEVNTLYGTTVIVSKRAINTLKSPEHNFRYIGLLPIENENRFAIYEYLGALDTKLADCLREHKQQFEQAVRLYDTNKLTQAKEMFAGVLAKCPNDKACEFYLSKCAQASLKPEKK